MTTLYRKYRPRAFEDIAGQRHITATLQAALKKEKIAHAYLFYGARGTGKTTTARVLADGLGARGLDAIEIDAASNRGIDDIRELRSSVALSPTKGSYKVYIIDEVHMLTKEAFAALLKTLEEPVKHAVFILATTELHKVPATILSRCQVYRFKRATAEEMKKRLTWILEQEKRTLSDDALEFVIARCDGCYRDAESLVGQILTAKDGRIEASDIAEFLGLPEKTLLRRFLQGLVAGQTKEALMVIDEVYAAGLDPDQFLHEAIRLSRDIVVEVAQGKRGEEFESVSALTKLPIIIRALLTAVQDLAYVPEPKIALQLAAMTVVQPSPAAAAPKANPLTSLGVNPSVLQKEPKKHLTPSPSPQMQRGENIEKVQRAWDQLIVAVKQKNPVASTFLRAITPTAWSEKVVSVRVQYALHRNFFEKPDNRKLVDEELGKLLGASVEVRYQLEETSLSPGIAVSEVRKKEEELYNTVKEVFAPK